MKNRNITIAIVLLSMACLFSCTKSKQPDHQIRGKWRPSYMIRDDNDNHLMDDAHIAIQGGIISFSKDGSCDFDQYSAGASSCRWKLVNNDSILVITVERGGITDSMRLDVNSITKDKLIFDSEVNFGSATSIIIHHLWMVYERP